MSNVHLEKYRILESSTDYEYTGKIMEFYPTEFLLPRIDINIKLEEFPFIDGNVNNPDFSELFLQNRINDLGHWEYYFPFSHGLTTRINSSFNDDTINFHLFRSKLISETIINLLGPEGAESTVLDLACHCGVFSMDVASRGVKHVHGVEYREKNLEQAYFLRDYYKIDNVSFEQGDVYDMADKPYDVVMCLGILYHVTQPVELIEYCFRNARKFAIIETVCHKQPVSAYMVVGDKNPDIAIEGTRSIEFQPTYRGVIDTMKQVGFTEIIEICGKCAEDIELFSDFSRRCFIAIK